MRRAAIHQEREEDSTVATMIGMFRADQQRERRLTRDNYSHLVVAFDVGLVLLEASPIRDIAAAVVHRIPGAIAIHHVALKQTRRLMRLGPKYGHVEAIVLQTDPLTPEGLATAFPSHIRRLWSDQISSAVLRRFPPELRLQYRSEVHQRDTEVWLKLPFWRRADRERLDEVSRIMSVMLGDRYTEQATTKGLLGAARDAIPGS
jgi:hypothetical protein